MKKAFLFPGQGAQVVGMGKDLYETEPVARRVFDEADQVLGFSISRLMFEGPREELMQTKNCQPAIVTMSVAVLEVLKTHYPEIKADYVAGLSLGEYSALVAADILGFQDAVALVRKRGEFMDEASLKRPGGMSCVLGLEIDVVSEIAKSCHCEIANLNCPGQVVVSGTKEDLAAFAVQAGEKGAKRVIPLDVSGAFHCSYMDEARDRLKEEIEKVSFKEPSCPLISNVDAKEQVDPEVIKANLIKQVNSATYWQASMEYLCAQGVDAFFEIGPGMVLKGLFRKIDRSVNVVTLSSGQELAGLKASA